MPWFMVDDAITTDEKVLALDPSIRAEAIGTWTLCGAWSSQRLKDGNIPSAIVTAMGGTEKGALALVEVGMWKRTRTGYKVHNWAKFQRTKAEVVKKREDEAERKRKYREAKAQADTKNVPHVSQRDTRGVPAVSGSPIPAHPSPSHPLKDTGQVGGGNSPKQGDSNDPAIQPCGKRHDPARGCQGCARQRESDERAALRAKSEAERESAAIERAKRQAEIDATPPTTPEDAARVRAAIKQAKEKP